MDRIDERVLTQRKHYVSVRAKFFLCLVPAVLWASLSLWLAIPWLINLAQHVGLIAAVFLIVGIAILPGFMNAFLMSSLLLDHRPRHHPVDRYPGVSILVAAYNEEETIAAAVQSIAAQAYAGPLQVMVINDGSSDNTASIVRALQHQYDWLELIDYPANAGKAYALNRGLAHARHRLVMTIDADSCLYHRALASLVERYLQDPPNTRAVAGKVLVRNSRDNWLTRAQEWDYFHGIAAIKRMQSLFQGTLVAQGAFSIYDRDTLVAVGGWPSCVGEDIVLTWAILKAGHRVGHCEDACMFTTVPNTVSQFVKQRQRWGRGMIEAFRQHPDILLKPRLSTFFIYWNLLFPWLDLAFTFGFLPGIVLACFGHFWIVGPMTLALLPLALAMSFLMFSVESHMFDTIGLRVRRNLLGFAIYVLAYGLLLQPASVLGYLNEILRTRKTWGTK
ncbi:MAG: glycosyltransferase [Burkholderiaceae bacterium]